MEKNKSSEEEVLKITQTHNLQNPHIFQSEKQKAMTNGLFGFEIKYICT